MNTYLKMGKIDDFFARAKKVARKADAGEPIPVSPKVITMEPAEFRAFISSNRLQILIHIREKRRASITSIVKSMKRDRAGVSRDIKALEAFGLVRVRPEKNPGHGQHKVVETAINANERLILQAEI